MEDFLEKDHFADLKKFHDKSYGYKEITLS